MAAIHSDEFKRDAVRIALSSGLTRRQVASDLGIGLKHSYFRDRQRGSIRMLPSRRPLPSIEIQVPTRFSRSARRRARTSCPDVAWSLEPMARPCSLFMISGGPNLWIASRFKTTRPQIFASVTVQFSGVAQPLQCPRHRRNHPRGLNLRAKGDGTPQAAFVQ